MPAKGSNRATGRVWQAAADALRTRPRRRGLARRRRRSPAPAEAVARLRAAGERGRVRHQQLEPAAWARSRRSWPATASPADRRRDHLGAWPPPRLVEPGERVLRVRRARGGRGARGAGRRRRCATATPTRCWSGSTATSTTSGCASPPRAVRRGARLLATNDDATYPTPDGPIPGGGAILAAVVTGDRGARPIVAGQAARADGRPRARPAGRRRGDGGGPSRHRRALRPARSATASPSCTPA